MSNISKKRSWEMGRDDFFAAMIEEDTAKKKMRREEKKRRKQEKATAKEASLKASVDLVLSPGTTVETSKGSSMKVVIPYSASADVSICIDVIAEVATAKPAPSQEELSGSLPNDLQKLQETLLADPDEKGSHDQEATLSRKSLDSDVNVLGNLGEEGASGEKAPPSTEKGGELLPIVEGEKVPPVEKEKEPVVAAAEDERIPPSVEKGKESANDVAGSKKVPSSAEKGKESASANVGGESAETIKTKGPWEEDDSLRLKNAELERRLEVLEKRMLGLEAFVARKLVESNRSNTFWEGGGYMLRYLVKTGMLPASALLDPKFGFFLES